jgi:polar amino acid transport system substrate-binding protein
MSAFRKLASLAIVYLAFVSSPQAKEYIVGVEDIDYYPIYAERGGDYSGYAREVLDAFAAEAGIVFTYKALPIKRLFDSFLSQKIDFKFPDSSYWKQDLKKGKKVVYSEPVLEYIDGVMVLPENLKKGKDSLNRLGVVRGFTPWDYLSDVEAGTVKVKENTSLDGLMKLVKNKRIDGVYFNVIVARYFLANTAFEKNLVLFDDSLPHTRSSYYLSTIKHPELIDKFNQFLKSKAGLIEQLKAKYNVKLL